MCVRIAIIATVILLFPHLGLAQTGFAGRIRSLQDVLEQLYDDMMPLCSRLIGVGRGIADASPRGRVFLQAHAHGQGLD